MKKNIIEKLRDNIVATTGLPFVYGAQGDVNRALDNAPLPCAFSYLIDTSAVTLRNGIVRERLTMAVFFIDKTHFDFEAVENESIIDAMKQKAFEWWLKNLNNAGELSFVSNNSGLRVYDEIADAIVTGYGLNVTIEDVEGVSRCQL